MGATLAQQVPALIEHPLDAVEPLVVDSRSRLRCASVAPIVGCGQDPNDALAREERTVEGYQQ